MESPMTMASPPPPPASSPSRLPHLSIRGDVASTLTPSSSSSSSIFQQAADGVRNKLIITSRAPIKLQPPPHSAPASIRSATASSLRSETPTKQQQRTPFPLELTHSNQNAASRDPASSPTTTTASTTGTESFLTSASLHHTSAGPVSGSNVVSGFGTGTGTMTTTGTGTSVADADDLREVVVTDPESPAYQALVKANHEKPDVSLLDKRPRIGHSKLGRHKYRADNRSFKKPAGKEIHTQHEQYALTYGMMCGILNSAGLQNPFKQRLTMDDFMRVDKRVFPPSSKLQHAFKFKDYSPDIFRQVRRRFCIDSADYMVTLCGDFNYIEFMSNSKSGQFFFYSHDGRFMIKTQTKDESKFLRRILPHYYKFVMENPNTLITRFYGMHRVKMHHLRRKMHFIIMASVFDTPLEIHARFDLKGSTVGRHGSQKDKQTHGVLKDMDLVDSGFQLRVGAEKRAMMLVQIRKDVEFLKRMKIMDYSLLIGVHDARAQIQKTIYGSMQPEQPTAKSQPVTPVGDMESKMGVAFANGELPVRLNRSVSVPEDSRPGERECMPCTTPNNNGTRASASDGGAGSGYEMDEFGAEFDFSDANSEDSSDDSSNVSEVDGFAVDHLPHVEIQQQGNGVLTPTSLRTAPSMASSLHAMEPISPRVLTFPGHSESVFCKDEGGIFGRDRHGRKNGYVYFVGVIDILQQYNTRKIAETFFKGLRHNRKEISAVNPVFYGDRFVEFMEKHVILDDTLLPSGAALRGVASGASLSATRVPRSPARPPSATSISTLHQL